MTERDVIESQIAKKQSEIEALDEKLKAAKVYVAALRDVLKILEKAARAEPSNDEGETKLRAGSTVAQAREIILAKGAPTHIDDLLESMGKEVTRDTKASLAGSLAAYVRREDIFTRPAPNTFGLIELGHFETLEDDEGEPPMGFGQQGQPFIDELDDDIPF